MDVYLIDGTYELFRHFFAVPASADLNGQEIGAVRGVLNSVLSMIEGGATHFGVATDHVVESFRNELYAGYKMCIRDRRTRSCGATGLERRCSCVLNCVLNELGMWRLTITAGGIISLLRPAM